MTLTIWLKPLPPRLYLRVELLLRAGMAVLTAVPAVTPRGLAPLIAMLHAGARSGPGVQEGVTGGHERRCPSHMPWGVGLSTYHWAHLSAWCTHTMRDHGKMFPEGPASFLTRTGKSQRVPSEPRKYSRAPGLFSAKVKMSLSQGRPCRHEKYLGEEARFPAAGR